MAGVIFLRTAAGIADHLFNTMCPMRSAERGYAAAHELASTTNPSTTTGCATTGGAGRPKK